MKLVPLDIHGAFRIDLEPISDERGFFARTFCATTFAQWGLETDFVQRSISYNKKRGTLRGLHYQLPPYAETKIVRCTKGAVFDVILDIRPESASYGRWQSVELSQDNHAMVYIPRGCAHGFQTLVDDSELLYEITPAHVPGVARGFLWDDPSLAIPWPLDSPIISIADRNWPPLPKSDALAERAPG